jgi:hypothetical protein
MRVPARRDPFAEFERDDAVVRPDLPNGALYPASAPFVGFRVSVRS